MAANGIGAANTLRGYRDLVHGMCLFYVWKAYKANGASTDRNAGTALEGWNKSDGQHKGDRNPPAGVPVWFGAKPSSSAGDVVISLGNGMVVATDYPVYGVVGVCTIQQRQDQIGRPYLGWTETILGAPIEYHYGAPASQGNATPISNDTSEEDNMRIIYSQHLDREFLIGDGGITHLIGGASAALNAMGVVGNRHVNQLGKDDFRKVVEAYGLSYEKTRLLEQGARLLLDGSVVDAGRVPWGDRWA